MDRLIYVGMTAAKHTMTQLAAISQNLANIETTGYKSDVNMFQAVPVNGPGNSTRTFVVNSLVGSDMSSGAIEHTGNPLDLAVVGQGWFTVKLADGSEAYTRNGNFKIDPNGMLQTNNGLSVMGEDGGPVSIPPNTQVTIGKDGTISTVPSGDLPNSVTILGRIKLVNPPDNQMVKGLDNLFRLKSGKPADADTNVQVMSGSLEGSNVNAIESMINMISLGRSFDMQMKLLQTADGNASKAGGLLNIG
ncbi:MAG: flagellar basal-body rod protein FlgF [Burkholderiales bacterium]